MQTGESKAALPTTLRPWAEVEQEARRRFFWPDASGGHRACAALYHIRATCSLVACDRCALDRNGMEPIYTDELAYEKRQDAVPPSYLCSRCYGALPDAEKPGYKLYAQTLVLADGDTKLPWMYRPDQMDAMEEHAAQLRDEHPGYVWELELQDPGGVRLLARLDDEAALSVQVAKRWLVAAGHALVARHGGLDLLATEPSHNPHCEEIRCSPRERRVIEAAARQLTETDAPFGIVAPSGEMCVYVHVHKRA